MAAFAFVCPAFGQNVILNAEGRVAASFPALTATGNTQVFAVAQMPWVHTVQINVTGGPATCTAKLQGSLDGVNFFDMNTAQTCTSGALFAVANLPVLFIRINLTTFSGGSSPTMTAFYAGVR